MAERVAVLADIHGNSPALRAVLQDVDRQGCSQIFLLGDIANGIDPHGCIQLLQACPQLSGVKGNAEHYILTANLDAFPRRSEPMYADLILFLEWFHARLTHEDLAWLRSFPDLLIWKGICLAHDSPLDRELPHRWHIQGVANAYQELCFHARGISPDLEADELTRLWAWLAMQGLSGLFCGHTHAPFVLHQNGRFICNAGSVGTPLDGDPRPSWAMVEEGRPVIRRVAYDIQQTLEMIDASPDFERPGVHAAYKMMIKTGWHWKVYT